MNRSLELNRKHIAEAFVEYCKRRSGGHPVCTVIVQNKPVILGCLTADAVHRCLTDCFEVKCFQKYGQAKSMKLLDETYASLLTKDNSKLTLEGLDFMTELMSNAVEIALVNPKDNTLGLEIY